MEENECLAWERKSLSWAATLARRTEDFQYAPPFELSGCVGHLSYYKINLQKSEESFYESDSQIIQEIQKNN